MFKYTISFDEFWKDCEEPQVTNIVGFGVDDTSAKEASIENMGKCLADIYNGKPFVPSDSYLLDVKYKGEKCEKLIYKKQFYFWSSDGTTGVNKGRDAFGGTEYDDEIETWSKHVYDTFEEAMVSKAEFEYKNVDTTPVSEGWGLSL